MQRKVQSTCQGLWRGLWQFKTLHKGAFCQPAAYRAPGNNLTVLYADFFACGIVCLIKRRGGKESKVKGIHVVVGTQRPRGHRNHYFILCVCVRFCRRLVSVSHCRSLCLSDHTGGGYDHYGFYPLCLRLFSDNTAVF